jgi:hypothetical protein
MNKDPFQGGGRMKRIAILALLACMFVPAVSNAAEWYEKLKLKGDVRFRNELIQQQDKKDNFRWRIRARLAAEAQINESWSATIGLSSGSDDPVSTNQTLTGGFSRKSIMLNLAYIDFHPKQVAGLNVIAGKMNLPFETADKTQLLWDNDLTPEGAAVNYKHAAGEKAQIFVNAAGFYLTDNDPDNEQWMSGGQAGFNVKPSDKVSMMAGAGYYDYHRIEGRPGVYNPSKFYGNSMMKIGTTTALAIVNDTAGVKTSDVFGYATDFNELEFFGTVDVKVNEKVALRLTGDYVNNSGADSLNAAYLFGGSLMYGKDKGSMKLSANYRKVEADAVIGAFTYSDPWGGGTNGEGFEFGFSYGLAKATSFDLTYLVDTKGVKDSDPGTDYRRFQADFVVKF